MKLRKRTAQAAVAVGVSMAMLVASSGVAYAGGPYPYAGNNDVGRRLTVCADSLDVHNFLGQLHYPQTFTVEGFDGANKEWVYGFAWGTVNAHGSVLNGWFCNA
ncbi:hypothetical protein [Krasilnikovia sp. MM14-A1259]|uniref:hypothetical protein n=1 Tax=Krasilnikovia sp. MM14-A1259 TaxID=3373539 RepID=UPI003802F271